MAPTLVFRIAAGDLSLIVADKIMASLVAFKIATVKAEGLSHDVILEKGTYSENYMLNGVLLVSVITEYVATNSEDLDQFIEEVIS